MYLSEESNWLFVSELTYDIVPRRSLETNETAVVLGQRPIFSSVGLWLGVAYEFD